MERINVPSELLPLLSFPTLPALQFSVSYPRGINEGIMFQIADQWTSYQYTVKSKSYKITCIEYDDAKFNSTVISPLTKIYEMNPECDIAIHEETFSSDVTSGQISGLKNGAYYRIFITTYPDPAEATRFGNNANATTPRNSYPVFPIVPTNGDSLQPQLSQADATALANLEQSNPAYIIYEADEYNKMITIQYLEKVLRTKNGLPYIHNLSRATLIIPDLSSNEIPFIIGYKPAYNYFNGNYYVNDQLMLTDTNIGIKYDTLYNITLKLYYEDGTSKIVTPIQVRSGQDPYQTVAKPYPQFTSIDDAKKFLAETPKALVVGGVPGSSIDSYYTAAAIDERLQRYRRILGWDENDSTKDYNEIAAALTAKINEPGYSVDETGNVTYNVAVADHYKFFYANLWLAVDMNDLIKAKDMKMYINGIEQLEAFQNTTIKTSQFVDNPYFNIKYPRILYLPNLAVNDIIRINYSAFGGFSCISFKNQTSVPYIIDGSNIAYSVPEWPGKLTRHFTDNSISFVTNNGITNAVSTDLFMIGKALLPNAPKLVRDDETLTLPSTIEYIPAGYFRESNIKTVIPPTGGADLFIDVNAFPKGAVIRANEAPYVKASVNILCGDVTPGINISKLYDTFASIFYTYDLNVTGGSIPTVKQGITQINPGFLQTSNIQKLNIDTTITSELIIKEGALPNNTTIFVNSDSKWVDTGAPQTGLSNVSNMIYTSSTTDLTFKDGLFYIKNGKYFTGYWIPLGVSPTSVVLPAGVRSVPNEWLPYATNITLPNEPFEIGNRAFSQTPGDSFFNYRASNARIQQSGITYRYIHNYSAFMLPYNIPSTLSGDIYIPSLSSYDRTDFMFSKDNSIALRYDSSFPVLGLEDIPLVNSITFSGRFPPIFTSTQLKDTQRYRFGDTSIMWVNSRSGPTSFDPAYSFDIVEGIADRIEFGNNIFDTEGSYKNGKSITTVRFARGSAPKQIGTRAFYGCSNLSVFTIPMSRVGDSAFYKNTSLGAIIFDNPTEIGASAFYECKSIPNLTISTSGNLTIKAGAFERCSGIMNVIITVGGNLIIEENAFKGCTNISQVSLNISGTTNLGANVFNGCTSMGSFVINSANPLTLNPTIFTGCISLQSVTMSGLSSSIDASLFSSITTLKTIILSFQDNANASIGAFAGLSQLQTVSITGGLTSIPANMFNGCTSLKTVTLNGALSNLPADIFSGCPNITTVAIKFAGVASCNVSFANFVNMKTLTITGAANTTVALTSDFVNGCAALQTLNISIPIRSNLTSAFNGCVQLRTLTLNFIEEINTTFACELSNLPLLTTVDITGNTTITSPTFLKGSTAIRNLTINGILNGNIDQSTLNDIRIITIRYGEANTRLPSKYFMNNVNLTSMTIIGGLKEIGLGAFYNCQGLKTLILPEGLEIIEDFAFTRSGISGELVIPSTVSILGIGYLIDCPNLKKVIYKSNILFFKDPTRLSSDIWKVLMKPTYTVYDISGDIQVMQDYTTDLLRIVDGEITYFDSDNNFVYTTNNTINKISLDRFTKNINIDIASMRKQKIDDILAYIKPLYATLSERKTLNELETSLKTSLYTIIFKLSEIFFNSNPMDQYSNISSEVQPSIDNILSECERLKTIDDATATYYSSIIHPTITTKFKDILDANRDIYNIGTNMTTIQIPVSIPEKKISIKVLTKDITNVTGSNEIIFEGSKVYLSINSPSAVINLKDETSIFVSGQIRVDITEQLGSEYYTILKHIDDNLERITNDTEINIDFKGAITSISSLTDITNSTINIESEKVVIYDESMKKYTHVKVNIKASTIKIYDAAFQLWNFSTINIDCSNVICGKFLFLDSTNITVNSTVDLTNRTKIIVADAGNKTLNDLRTIVMENTNISLDSDTRDVRIQTYIPPNADITTGFLVICFQQLSTLREYAIIIAPQDWYWCYHTGSESNSDFQESFIIPHPFIPNTTMTVIKKYPFKYMPDDAERDSNNNLILSSKKLPNPSEYCGLKHSFGPDEISYNGIVFKRKTELNSGANMRIRAIYSNTEAAGKARLKQGLSEAFDIALMVLSVVTAPFPIPAFIVGAIDFVKTAKEIIEMIDDQLSPPEIAPDYNEYTNILREKDVNDLRDQYVRELESSRSIASAISTVFKVIFRSICRIFNVSRNGRLVARLSRPAGAAGVSSAPGSTITSNINETIVTANPIGSLTREGRAAVTSISERSLRRATIPLDRATSGRIAVDSDIIASPSGVSRIASRRSLESVRSINPSTREIRAATSSVPTSSPEQIIRAQERLREISSMKEELIRKLERNNANIKLISDKIKDAETKIAKLKLVKGKKREVEKIKQGEKYIAERKFQLKVCTATEKEFKLDEFGNRIPIPGTGEYETIELSQEEALLKRIRILDDEFTTLSKIVSNNRDITQSEFMTDVISKVNTYFDSDITNIELHPNYNQFLQSIHDIISSAGSSGIDFSIGLMTYLDKLRLYDTSSLNYAQKVVTLKKEFDPTYNPNEVKLRDIAAYNTLTRQVMIRTNGFENSSTFITHVISDVIDSSISAKTPPYMFPLASPRNYADGARADYIHHYTTLKTNTSFSPLETDLLGNQNAAMQTANPLMWLSNNYMFAGTFLGEERDPTNPQTSSYGYNIDGTYDNVILECNDSRNEVYLAYRPVTYGVSKDERPNNVFCGATNININIPKNITFIDEYAYCSTDGSVGDFPFTVQSLTLPSTITSIGYRAFYRSNVKNVFFPSSLKFIGNSAFENCGLVNAVAMRDGEQLLTPKNIAIRINNNTDIIFNKSDVTFSNFTNAVVVDSTGNTRTFAGRDNNGTPTILTVEGMTSLNITNLSNIKRYIRYVNTDSLVKYEKPGPIGSFSFDYNSILQPTMLGSKIILFNPIEEPTVDGQKWYWNWTSFGEGLMYKVELTNQSSFSTSQPYRILYSTAASKIVRSIDRDTGTIIEDNAFSGNSDLTTFIAPDDTISIGNNVFSGCVNLTVVDLPATLTSIGDNVFSDCVSLTSIELPASLTSTGANIFAGATALKTITFTGGIPPAITQEFLKSLPPSVSNINVPPANVTQLKQLIVSSGLSSKFTISNQQVASNSLPLAINPYRAMQSVMVYTKETIDALARGNSLPVTKETSWSPAPPGALMRSLGRQITIAGSNGLHRYKFCEVQHINGPTTEGVSGNAGNRWNTGWICIWAADGTAPVL